MIASVTKLFVEAADGITSVCVLDDSNEPFSGELPFSLPAELARIDMRAFLRTIQTQIARLKRKSSDDSIEGMSQ